MRKIRTPGSLSIGIVGLPNVGKSTLFNALTKSQVPAENYPFCTVEPNVGIVEVPDDRLRSLADKLTPPKVIPAAVRFVDIAGLVEGASKGEGLGNKFLSHIREVDVIVHVVREFENDKITHVTGKVDPARDVGIIETELILKDIETISKVLENVKAKAKAAKSDDKIHDEVAALDKVAAGLNSSVPLRKQGLSEEELEYVEDYELLSLKPVIYVWNHSEEGEFSGSESKVLKKLEATGDRVLPMNIKLERDLAELSDEEKDEYLKELGIEEVGLEKLIGMCYKMLGLITFFTFNEKELRAWTVVDGTLAPQAAGVIHSDLETNFICADVISYDSFVETGGWVEAKEKGQLRTEGRDYEVSDGDIIYVKHGK